MTDVPEASKKKLEMSLDDVIKEKKSQRPEKRFNNRGGDRRGNDRRGGNRRDGDRRGGFKGNFKRRDDDRRGNRNFRPYRNDDTREDWKAGKRDQDGDTRRKGSFDRFEKREDNNKVISLRRNQKCSLKVENIHFSISNEELTELFSTVGNLKKCKIIWDNMGRSTETAIVEYETEKDAQKAIQDYNDAELDGKTLKVRYLNEDDVPKIKSNRSIRKY